MALIGVLISLFTQGVRRDHDAGLPKDRTLPLYLAVFAGIWIIGLAFVAVRELRVRYQKTYRAQRLPLGYILATVTFLAIGSLAVTVLAVQISRQRASRPALEEARTPVRAIAPAALPALGYLPPDVDLVAGVHVAEIGDDPAAQNLLKGLLPGPADADLSIIPKWTGLRLQDVDHVVLGLRVQGQLIPRFNLVVRTLKPYDAAALRKSLNVHKTPEPGKKELYRVELDRSLLTPILWFADDRTVVVGLKPEDLEQVPAKEREGIENLGGEFNSILKERVSPGTPIWMAGRPENWDNQLEILLARWRREGHPVDTLKQVRMFGVWLQFNDAMTLNAAFQCADVSSAKALEAYLTGHDREGLSVLGASLTGLACSPSSQGPLMAASALLCGPTSLGVPKPFSVPAPRPELAPLYGELRQSLKSDRNNTWVVLQAKASAETMRRALVPH
jgi:hypothetical protein